MSRSYEPRFLLDLFLFSDSLSFTLPCYLQLKTNYCLHSHKVQNTSESHLCLKMQTAAGVRAEVRVPLHRGRLEQDVTGESKATFQGRKNSEQK